MAADLKKVHQRAGRRLHQWVNRKIEQDAVSLARVYRKSRGDLLDRLRQVYYTLLSDEPTFVRARQSGALGAIDFAIDEVVGDAAKEIFEKTKDKYTDFLAKQPKKVGGRGRRLKKLLGFTPSAAEVMHELTTSVVVGGTWADRLFHISGKLKADLNREIRQGLFNKETFDELRARVHKVFGVDRLATPKSHAYGSLKIYKNEARRQWNLLMKRTAEVAEERSVWFTVLDDSTTPGCAARHGVLLDDMDDDTIPRHPNCRCTVMPVDKDFDVQELRLEGSAWLKANGYSRKEAMLEESAVPALRYRVGREVWEKYPGLRTVTFGMRETVAVVSPEQAERLKLGRDPGVPWKTGDPRVLLGAALQETSSDPAPGAIVALAATRDTTQGRGRGLVALLDAGTGRVLFEARADRESDSYTRASVAVGDSGLIVAVKQEGWPLWTLPGGHVEDGEDPSAAAEREFWEETGRRCRVTKYLGEYEIEMSTGDVANNLLFEGELTGERREMSLPNEEGITEVKSVHIVDLDPKEQGHVMRLLYADDKAEREKLSEAADVVHVTSTGTITAYPWEGPRRSVVIAAPHGDTDTGTRPVVLALKDRLECSAVIAEQFDPADNGGERLNINRPTEGIAGDVRAGEDPSEEKVSVRAAKVYKVWCSAVIEAAGHRAPRLYIEIHDNDNPRTQGHLEVATVGVTPEQAAKIRASWESLDTSLGMKIEPLDELEWAGAVSKDIGIFAHLPAVMQVELPAKFCSLAAEQVHGAIENLEDWLEDVLQIL